MPHRVQYVACPYCDGQKTQRARCCHACYRRVYGRTGPPPRTMAAQGRSIDFEHTATSHWRPPHQPPACEACRGFGYIPRRDEHNRGAYIACPDCEGHPGSTMTHEAWTAARASA